MIWSSGTSSVFKTWNWESLSLTAVNYWNTIFIRSIKTCIWGFALISKYWCKLNFLFSVCGQTCASSYIILNILWSVAHILSLGHLCFQRRKACNSAFIQYFFCRESHFKYDRNLCVTGSSLDHFLCAHTRHGKTRPNNTWTRQFMYFNL